MIFVTVKSARVMMAGSYRKCRPARNRAIHGHRLIGIGAPVEALRGWACPSAATAGFLAAIADSFEN
jgi:hypothetical protein